MDESPKSAMQALRDGVTRILICAFDQESIIIVLFCKDVVYVPPLDLRALSFVRADIQAQGLHPKSRHALAMEITAIVEPTSERRSMSGGSFLRNSITFPFSIHGETRQSLFSKWYSPKKGSTFG
jgi:hypothetical protein